MAAGSASALQLTLCIKQGHHAFALLLTPLQGNISPAGAGERKKAQETPGMVHTNKM